MSYKQLWILDFFVGNLGRTVCTVSVKINRDLVFLRITFCVAHNSGEPTDQST